jgi:glycosyltransferase involved in cell wall biosynthesis
VPEASVVIAAFNEARHIGRCLRSLEEQELPLEVIVIDDGSEDETAAVATRFGARVLRLPHRGPARARNEGARLASSEILVFIDADMAAAPGSIAALLTPIVASEAVGSFSKELYLGNPESRWARAYCRIRRLGCPRLLPESFPEEWANYRAVRKDRFLAVGGYDDVGYGEDMTLAPKLARPAMAAPGAKFLHFNPDSLAEIFENARWIGRGHDIGVVAHPWRDNAPWRAMRKAISEVRGGIDAAVIPARLAYSLGILVGLCGRTIRPARHWK